jgi:hypothetical protein
MTEATVSSNTMATFKGRELAIHTWSHHGPFIEVSSGLHYCPGEGCGLCARGEDHNYHHGLPVQGFTDDQGRFWSPAKWVRTDESVTFGWWESITRWFLQEARPYGSCPDCGGDGETLERGFTCACGFRGEPVF